MPSTFLRIGHRGAAAYATENTLSSIQTALACGVDMVEIDVRRTRDGHLILAHEPFLQHGPRRYAIRRLTLDQLRQLCLPGGELVTTLDEALRYLQGRAKINIDLKEGGYEEAVVWQIEQRHLEADVMVSSLSLRSLCRVKTLNPRLFVALSYPSSILLHLSSWRLVGWLSRCLARRGAVLTPVNLCLRHLLPWHLKTWRRYRDIDGLMIRAPFITQRLVDLVHRRELKLYVWPADQAQDVAKLEAWGVDGIESNRPDVFLAA